MTDPCPVEGCEVYICDDDPECDCWDHHEDEDASEPVDSKP